MAILMFYYKKRNRDTNEENAELADENLPRRKVITNFHPKTCLVNF